MAKIQLEKMGLPSQTPGCRPTSAWTWRRSRPPFAPETVFMSDGLSREVGPKQQVHGVARAVMLKGVAGPGTRSAGYRGELSPGRAVSSLGTLPSVLGGILLHVVAGHAWE